MCMWLSPALDSCSSSVRTSAGGVSDTATSLRDAVREAWRGGGPGDPGPVGGCGTWDGFCTRAGSVGTEVMWRGFCRRPAEYKGKGGGCRMDHGGPVRAGWGGRVLFRHDHPLQSGAPAGGDGAWGHRPLGGGGMHIGGGRSPLP